MAEADKKDQKGNEAVATAPAETAPQDIREDSSFEGITNENSGLDAGTPQNAPQQSAAPAAATPPAAAAEEPASDKKKDKKGPVADEPEAAESTGKKSKFLTDEYQQMVYRKVWRVDEIDPEVLKVVNGLTYDNKKNMMTFQTDAGDINWGFDHKGREYIGRRGFFNSMTQELAEAQMTLAKAHGWTAITLHGRESTKEMLWLSAQRQGITVNNFVPSKDSEVYKIWQHESQEVVGIKNAKETDAPANDAAPDDNAPETAADAPAAPEASAPAAAEATAEEPAAPAAAEATAEEPAAPAAAEATAEEPAAPAAAEATAEEPAAPAAAEATAEEPAAPAAAEATAEEPAAPAATEATAEEPAAPAAVEATAEEPAAPAAAEATAEEPAEPKADAPVVSKFGAVEPAKAGEDDPWQNPPANTEAAPQQKPPGHDDPYSKESLAARGMVNPLPAGDQKYEAWEKKKEGINRADYSGWEQDYRDVAAVERMTQSAAEAKSPAHAEGISKLQDALKSGKVEIKDSFDRLAISKIDTPAGYQQAADYFQKKAGGFDLGLPKVETPPAAPANNSAKSAIKNKGP